LSRLVGRSDEWVCSRDDDLAAFLNVEDNGSPQAWL
jgi:hypothetical protein